MLTELIPGNKRVGGTVYAHKWASGIIASPLRGISSLKKGDHTKHSLKNWNRFSEERMEHIEANARLELKRYHKSINIKISSINAC